MRLFVTGGAGFIGSTVVRKAIEQGHKVLNVDKLTYAGNLSSLRSLDGSPHYSFLKGDICDSNAMRTAINSFQPDVLMNLAAESHVDRSIDGPAEFIETNIVGTFRLLEAVRSYNKASKTPLTFHHISTDEVFGSLGSRGEFTEDSPYQPNSPYSASKASSDMLVRAWGETFGIPTLISNCSNNYGPYQYPEKLVPTVISAMRQGNSIPIYGDGSNVRDWLHVEDHADALLLIAKKGKAGETYNVGGRAEKTNLELVRTLCDLMDRKFSNSAAVPHSSLMKFVTDRPGHDARYAVDCSKIERELGWRAKYTFEQGMGQTLDWYLSNQGWIDQLKQDGFVETRRGSARTDN